MILGSIEAMQRWIARVRLPRSGLIDAAFERPDEFLHRRRSRPGNAWRRHHSRMEHSERLFNIFRALRRMHQIDLGPGKASRFELVVMATEAILVHQGLLGGD